MSESSHKHKPSMTGAALRRGPANAETPPAGGKGVHRRRTVAPPPAAGSHLGPPGHGVSDTASSISTSTNQRGKEYVPPVKLENTYRMEPYANNRFGCGKVRETVKGILESYLSGEEYEKDKCPTLTRDISQMIKQRVREMNFERYKIVVTVVMGENTGQGCELASRFLWNTNTDNYEAITYKNKTLFAVASVYGVYYEWNCTNKI